MRGADNLRLVFSQKLIGLPVQGMARVHAIILVGIDLVAATHDETLERPVTITNVKFAAVRIVKVFESADHDLCDRFATHAPPPPACAGQ